MIYYGGFRENNNYNRRRAVRYALTYALTPNPAFRYFASHGEGGGDCSNFISQCLYAGGAPLAYGTYPWWYRKHIANRRNDTWSISWSVAHSLYLTLKNRYRAGTSGLKAHEVKDMDQLELGDIIQYEDAKGKIYHSAIITAFTQDKGQRVPLISQHSYDLRNASYFKPKAKKMHLMKIEIS